ncbi:MAG: polyprenyl synthetase family protein [Planctomycetota bacterium]
MPTRNDTENMTLPTDAELIAQVDERLRKLVEYVYMPDNLRAAITYALFSGGKRVRPLLCMRSCIACGGNPEDAVSAAGAVELIHCFSLVHDDLPAMDDDDLRRGRPTLHKHTNEAMAILAGDAMTAMAFKLIAQWCHDDDRVTVELIGALASATTFMIGGQVHDTMGGFPDDVDERERLRRTHLGKTAAMLSYACHMGGLCAKGSPQEVGALTIFGNQLGLMFQAVDDLLDVTQSTEQVGKQTGKDAAAGKLTYPGLLGIDGTRAEIAKLLDQSLAALEPLGPPADPLRAMARKLAERTK